ncbi:MAG: serine/threonine protein kinase [Planctomycetota bacterium]|jgi:serine/threonine protein kinase
MTGVAVLLKVFIAGALIIVGAVLAIWLLVKGSQGLIWGLSGIARGIGFLVKQVLTFVRNTFGDAFKSIGALLTAVVLLPLALLNLLFFRWSAAKHYARALEDEVISFGLGAYRVFLGNPLQLVGMGIITDGFERRIPDVVARAPRNSTGSIKDGKFDGYKVTGVLPAGGSGARLFLATPLPDKLKALQAAGFSDPGKVVIKAFSLSAGSTLSQIVRESRALESARRLGLILEHNLADKAFHYVMPYVPGDNLDVVITKMHAKHGDKGLSDRQVRVALGYVGDLLYTLDAFHDGGLWHKDIKPSNLIISEGRAHLVDLGLVTPLSSAMTLTTHGTEYFRDPEMVRQAMRGVKVNEVNGVKFDLYSTGALLFTMIENSFPAHGSLSRVTARCPSVITWIIRRAMADLDDRYDSSQEMLADVRTVLAAKDPFAVRPADLPSVNGNSDWSIPRGARESMSMASTASSSSTKTAPDKPKRNSRGKRLRPIPHTTTGEKTRRRSTGRSLAASCIGLLFLLGAMTVGGLMLGTTRTMSAQPDSYSVFSEDPVEWRVGNNSVGSLPVPVRPQPIELSIAAEKAQETELNAEKNLRDLRRKWSRKLDSHLDHLTDVARREAKKAGEAFEQSGMILLLQDLDAEIDHEWIDALQGELEQRNFKVFGNPSDGIGDEHDILLTAGARTALGISGQDDPEGVARLEQYLKENPSLNALIWVGEGQEKDSLQFHFVRAQEAQGSKQGTFALSAQ